MPKPESPKKLTPEEQVASFDRAEFCTGLGELLVLNSTLYSDELIQFVLDTYIKFPACENLIDLLADKTIRNNSTVDEESEKSIGTRLYEYERALRKYLIRQRLVENSSSSDSQVDAVAEDANAAVTKIVSTDNPSADAAHVPARLVAPARLLARDMMD